jgi:hypothetical protein
MTLSLIDLHRLPAGAQYYALLDGAHPRYSLPRLIYEQFAQPQWQPLYQATEYEELLDISPVLLRLDDPAGWLDIWQTAHAALPGCMLCSAAPLPVLIQHLQGLLTVSLDNGGSASLRFYDPRVGPAFWQSLASDRRAAWSGPVDAWLWPLDARRGYRAALAPSAEAAAAAPAGRFRWSEAQQQHFLTVSTELDKEISRNGV